MWNLLYLVSGPYKDGKRAVWTNGSQYMTKLDYDTFDIIAKLRMPGTDHADGLAHENFIKVFDSDAPFKEKLEAAKKSGLPPVDGVYTLLGSEGLNPTASFNAFSNVLVFQGVSRRYHEMR